MVYHQLTVTDQYPFAVYPGGKSHCIFISNVFYRTQHCFVGTDDLIKYIGEHAIGVADNTCSIQDDRVNLALIKWFDSVQDDVGRTEQIFCVQNDCFGAGEGINCRISRNHCAGRDELLGHPIEWKVCRNGRGERSADTHDRSEGGNCFCDIFVKEVSQHRQNDTCKQTDWGKHAAHSFCMVLGIGIIQEVCEEWAGFWISDGVFFHRKSFGDVAQQVAVL